MHKPFKMRPNRIIYYYKFICVANKDCSFFLIYKLRALFFLATAAPECSDFSENSLQSMEQNNKFYQYYTKRTNVVVQPINVHFQIH